MTDYQTSEISVKSGQPVELLDIAMGLQHWRHTTAGYKITYLYNDYETSPCKCSEIKTSDLGNESVEVEIERGHALAVMCVAGAPEQQITLTKYRGHGTDFVKSYFGYLANFKFNDKGKPILIFESLSSKLMIAGGLRRAMRLCGHKLYGFRCGLNKESYKITGTIDTISGVTITATEFGTVSVDDPAVYGDLTGLSGCTYLASTESSIAPAAGAFDNSISQDIVVPRHRWESSGSGIDQWIYCKWTAAQKVKKVRIYKMFSYLGDFSTYNVRYFRVEGSNNGIDWTAIDAVTWSGDCQFYDGEGGSDTEILNTAGAAYASATLDNTTAYTYYRIYIFSNWGGTTVVVPEIEMIEADNAMSQHQFGAGGEIIVGYAHRTIIAHNGTEITINRPFRSDVLAGMSFIAYAGCSHTPDCCREKFANMINYGGQKDLPVKNPYTGRNSLVR